MLDNPVHAEATKSKLEDSIAIAIPALRRKSIPK